MDATKIIQNYLEEMASKDANFSARYHDASKNMNECMQYIIEQAKKQAENNAACIHSDEVFGWAVHYYQEASVKPYAKKTEAKVTAAPAEPTAKKLEMKPKAQPKTKKASAKKPAKQVTKALELDLFG